MYACRRVLGSFPRNGPKYLSRFSFAKKMVMTSSSVASDSKSSSVAASGCIRQLRTTEEVREAWALGGQSLEITAEQLPFERFSLCHRACPDLFRGHFVDGKMTGFVCGTLGTSGKWTHDSAFYHDPEGAIAFLHALCVYPEYRQMGVGRALLTHLVRYIKEDYKGVTRMCFICQAHMVPVYTRWIDFTYTGPSKATKLGLEQWCDMEYLVPASLKEAA